MILTSSVSTSVTLKWLVKALVPQMILHHFFKNKKYPTYVRPDRDRALHLFCKQSLNDLVRDLKLSKEKRWSNLLLDYKNQIFFCRGIFLSLLHLPPTKLAYFSSEELLQCNDVNSLMQKIGCDFWRVATFFLK